MEDRNDPNRRSLVTRRKSLWKMVRSMLIPRRVFTSLAACGGSRSKRRRRIEKLKQSQAPIVRQSLRRQTSIPPPPPPEEDFVVVQVENALQNLSISSNDNRCLSDNQLNSMVIQADLHNVIVDESTTGSERNNHTDIILDDRIPVPGGDCVIIEGEGEQGRLPSINNSNSSENSENEENRNTVDLSILNYEDSNDSVVRRRKKVDSVVITNEFHGWRKSSIEVASDPPTTLKWIPSGLQIGDKVMWVTEDQPERAVVRWIGKIRGEYYAGIEFERRIGNSSGLYGYGVGLFQRLFTCDLGFGRFVPVTELVLYSDFHDKGLKAGFICIICRDDFLELPDAEGAGDGQMVATKCGHLYHGFCIDQWFAKCRADGSHQCPHCQQTIEMDEIIRLFPAQV